MKSGVNHRHEDENSKDQLNGKRNVLFPWRSQLDVLHV